RAETSPRGNLRGKEQVDPPLPQPMTGKPLDGRFGQRQWLDHRRDLTSLEGFPDPVVGGVDPDAACGWLAGYDVTISGDRGADHKATEAVVVGREVGSPATKADPDRCPHDHHGTLQPVKNNRVHSPGSRTHGQLVPVSGVTIPS